MRTICFFDRGLVQVFNQTNLPIYWDPNGRKFVLFSEALNCRYLCLALVRKDTKSKVEKFAITAHASEEGETLAGLLDGGEMEIKLSKKFWHKNTQTWVTLAAGDVLRLMAGNDLKFANNQWEAELELGSNLSRWARIKHKTKYNWQRAKSETGRWYWLGALAGLAIYVGYVWYFGIFS